MMKTTSWFKREQQQLIVLESMGVWPTGLADWSSSLIYGCVHNPWVSRNVSAIQASCCHGAIEKLPALCWDRGHHQLLVADETWRITEEQSVQVLFVFGWRCSYRKGLTKHVACFNVSYNGHCSSIRVFLLRCLRTIPDQHYPESSQPIGCRQAANVKHQPSSINHHSY